MSEVSAQGSGAGTPVGAPASQDVTTQQPPQEAAKAPETDYDLEWSRRFNEISRKERQLMQEKRQAKEALAKLKEFEEKRSRAKENPLEWLKESGLTYEEVTNYLLNDGKVPVEDRVKALEARLEMEKSERQREKDEMVKAEEANIEKTFRSHIAQTIHNNADFELTARHGVEGVNMVFDVIQAYHDQTNGQMLTIEQAAKEVEAHLEREAETMLKSTKKLEKFFPKYEQPHPSDTPKGSSSETQGLTTLTHQAVTSAPAPSQVPYLDHDESKRRAAAWLNAQLKR